jgi:hypothetical protein
MQAATRPLGSATGVADRVGWRRVTAGLEMGPFVVLSSHAVVQLQRVRPTAHRFENSVATTEDFLEGNSYHRRVTCRTATERKGHDDLRPRFVHKLLDAA